jgi:uncharacterized protein YbaR (Trm112 family)
MNDRRTIRCPICKETFSYLIQISPEALEQGLLVKLTCPFCKAKLKIDLSIYNRQVVEIYREGNASQLTELRLELPDELPAQIDD